MATTQYVVNNSKPTTLKVNNGVRNGDSVGKIITDTAKNTLISGATRIAPKIINKSLSGKYLKLNRVQKLVKKLTAGPYQGKYSKDSNYLGLSISDSLKRAGINVGIDAGFAGFKVAGRLIFE